MDLWTDSSALGPAPLVPMSLGEILDRTWRLVRNHARLFLGIAAVPTVAVIVVMGAVLGPMFAMLGPQMTGNSTTPPVPPPWLGLVFLFIYPGTLLIYALYMPAAAFATTQANRGIVVTLRQAYSVAWSRFGRSVWLMILGLLYVVAPIFVIAALIGVVAVLMNHGATTGAGAAYAFFLIPLLILLYLCIFIYSVLIMLRFAVAYPACIEEDLPAWKALRRSVRLTNGAKGRIFLVMLVVYAIVYAIDLACILVFFAMGAVVGIVAVSAHVKMGSPAFIILIGIAALAYMIVIGGGLLLKFAGLTTALSVIYHDQRIRENLLATQPSA